MQCTPEAPRAEATEVDGLPMRILITTHSYAPNKDGVAEASRVMAEGLAALGWDMWVATGYPFDGQPAAPSESVKGVTIDRFSLDRDQAEQEIHRYQDFVRAGRFDVIVNQCWEVWSTTLMQPLLSELKSAKVLVSHGYSQHIYHWAAVPTMGLGVWLRGLRWTLARFSLMIRRYDRLIFLSEKKGWGRFFDHSVATWIDHPGIEVVPNGTDPRLMPPDDRGFRARHGIGSGPMVLYVANYFEGKNQKLALRVFRDAAIDGAKLVFIGSELGAYGRELLADIKRAAMTNVVVLEKQSRDETFAAFAAADAFLLTSKAETQPIVLIEAMAAGVPWVSTDTGCVSTMPGGLTGASSVTLAGHLRRVISDPELRRKLKDEAARAVDSHYSSEATLAAFDRIFRSLLS